MHKNNNLTLFRSMSVYFFQFFVPLVLVTIALNIFALFIIHQRVIDEMEYELNVASNDLDNYLEQIERFAFDISINEEIQDLLISNSSPYISTYAQTNAFDSILGLNRYYDLNIVHIDVTTPEQNNIFSIGYTPIRNSEETADFPESASHNAWVYVGPVSYYDRTSKSINIISYYQNVYQLSSNRFIGVIRIDVSMEYLTDICGIPTPHDRRDLYFEQGNDLILVQDGADSDIRSHEPKQLDEISIKVGDSFVLLERFNSFDLILENNFLIPLTAFALVFCILFIILSYRFLNLIVSPLYTLNESIQTMSSDKPLSRLTFTKGSPEIRVIYDGFNQLVDNLNEYIDKNREIMRQEQLAQTLYFQSQINPHFLYNTLDSLRWIALKNKDNEVAGGIYKLSTIYRYYLNHGDAFVPIQEEVQLINDYMSVQKLRFGNKFEFRLEIQDHVKELPIPKLLLQPLIENAVQHAFPDQENGCFIILSILQRGSMLLIRILDNGCGIEEELLARFQNDELLQKDSFALSNIKRRLELYYGEEAAIRLRSRKNKGTFIRIAISGICSETQNLTTKGGSYDCIDRR